jgi:nitrite reductase/ring-hydroxylating ferredoxin subunit
MAQWVKIGTREELPPPGEAREFTAGNQTVCVANADGSFSAMDNVCRHHGGPLGQGMVVKGKVICPWHGWEYDVSTGACKFGAEFTVPVYPMKLEGEDVFVKL